MKKRIAACITVLLCIIAGTVQANKDEKDQEKKDLVYRINITDSGFSPNLIRTLKGHRLILEVRNIGKASHNFVMPELDVVSYNLRTGERMRLIISAGKSGSYKFYSDAPGAPETGFTGRLIVR